MMRCNVFRREAVACRYFGRRRGLRLSARFSGRRYDMSMSVTVHRMNPRGGARRIDDLKASMSSVFASSAGASPRHRAPGGNRCGPQPGVARMYQGVCRSG